jgi:hypothetical protein
MQVITYVLYLHWVANLNDEKEEAKRSKRAHSKEIA